MLGAVVVPGRQLGLIGAAAGDGQATLHHLNVEPDANVLPVLLYRLDELIERGVGSASHGHDQPQPALAITAQAVALSVLLVEAYIIQHGIGLLWVIRGPHGAVLRAG